MKGERGSMKIGEIFTEGKRKFEVIGFASGYPVSKFIGFSTDEPKQIEIFTDEPVNEKKEEITQADVNYEEMQYSQLKQMCAQKGISAKGSKQDLIDRLRG